MNTDPVKSAEAAGLRYISDTIPGITRIFKNKSFVYIDENGNKVKDEKILARIKALVIPPAWQNVWISPYKNSHLQATGYDVKGRKQYKYHPDWSTGRNHTKFSRLSQFAHCLPEIRKKVEKELSRKNIDREKVIAAVIILMEKSCMRIGNREYAIKNQSFGITTLRDRHVEIKGAKLRFEFVGKKGIHQNIELEDRRLANIIKKCKDIPGYELFQYYDENDYKHSIESGDINAFLQSITGVDFSAKDFRTWAGTLQAFRMLREMTPADAKTQLKKQIVDVIKEVSKKLGNTPAVCRKYYIHPFVLESFENNTLTKFIENYKKKKNTEKESAYHFYDEEMLRSLLENK